MKKKKKNLKAKDRLTRLAEKIYAIEMSSTPLSERMEKIEALTINLSLKDMIEIDNLVQKMFKQDK